MVGVAWQPIAFLALLVVLIVIYEAWASKRPGYTISEAMRRMTNKNPWIAILILILCGFFFCHCFGRSLHIS